MIEYKQLSLQQKLEILRKDFIDRDQTTFVKVRRTGRLGWESLIPEGDPYSHYMLAPSSDKELIRTSYRLAEDIIKVMDTPVKVRVKIAPDSSKTDGKNIWVATEVFDDTDLPAGNRVDTFLGLAIHEGCHVLYTDFNAYKGITEKIIKFLENILEDERIERELGEYKPGLANFLVASKYYYFDRYVRKIAEKQGGQPLGVFERLLNSIISLVRYPKTIIQSDLEEFADILLGVRDILIPYPGSTLECVRAAEKIYELIKMHLTEQQMKGGEPQEGDGPSSSQKGSASKDAQRIMEESFDRMESALKDLASDPDKATVSAESQAKALKKDRFLGMVCDGRAEEGTQKDSLVIRGIPNQEKYNDSLSRVRQYVPAIARSLRSSSQEYKFIHRGMRNGFLDTGKIAEAFQGVPTVYMREGKVKSDKVSVCILLDESGSMYGEGEQAARDTAVLLNEALGTLPCVDLYIYGHSTDGSTALYVYSEKSFKPKFALGGTDSRWGNNDGTAIKEAAARVRRHTKDDCLMFVISDGAPNEPVEDVRKAVQDVEKQKFTVLAVSIEPQYDPSLMYPRNINFTDLSRLSIDLAKVVKNAIAEKTKRQTF